MKYSVITLCCNRLEYTVQSVNSVCKCAGTTDYEHIVVNQASTDGTREWLDYVVTKLPGTWFSRVRPLHREQNWGYWRGYGAGFEVSQGEYIVCMDNDIVVETIDFLDIGRQVLEESGFDIVAPQLREAYYTRPERKIGGRIDDPSSHIPYPTAFFMMRRKDFLKDLTLCDDYVHFKKSTATDRIAAYQIDGRERGASFSQSKQKYPPHVIYSNLVGPCPMGAAPHRLPGCESEYYRK